MLIRLEKLHKTLFDIRDTQSLTDDERMYVTQTMEEMKQDNAFYEVAAMFEELAGRMKIGPIKIFKPQTWHKQRRLQMAETRTEYLRHLMIKRAVRVNPMCSERTLARTRELVNILSRDNAEALSGFCAVMEQPEKSEWGAVEIRYSPPNEHLMEKWSISMIDLCAFMGASACFKFCVSSGHKVCGRTFEWALHGGTFEIVRLCIDRLDASSVERIARREANDVLLEGRNSLYEFLSEQYGARMSEASEEEACAVSLNIPMLAKILRERGKYVRPQLTVAYFERTAGSRAVIESLYSAEASVPLSADDDEHCANGCFGRRFVPRLPSHFPTWGMNKRR